MSGKSGDANEARVSINSRRPCVASAYAGRSHEPWSPSRADAFGFWAAVRGWRRTEGTQRACRPPLWPAPRSPLLRPSRDSSVCTCGPSRNDKVRCDPVVRWPEESLRECTAREADGGLPKRTFPSDLSAFGHFCSGRRPEARRMRDLLVRPSSSTTRWLRRGARAREKRHACHTVQIPGC